MDTVEEKIIWLFEANYERLFRYVTQLVGRGGETEDIIQQTFLKLYVLLMQGKNITTPGGWLFHTARNLAIDHLRKQRARLLAECSMEEMQPVLISPRDPEKDLLQKERIHSVQMALAALPPQERACLKLRARGLIYKEIAEVLGISVNSVGPTLAHGLRKLRVSYVEKEL